MSEGASIAILLGSVTVVMTFTLYFILTAFEREEKKLIKKWYGQGPYHAEWTEDGIYIRSWDSELFPDFRPPRGKEVDEHAAKLFAAKQNRDYVEIAERRALLAKRAGEIVE